MRFTLLFSLALVSALAQDSLVRQAPAKSGQVKNPFSADERAVRAGAKLFRKECAACHGYQREGSRNAPALDTSEVYEAPAGVVFWILTNGKLHRGMPSFAHLPEPQRWQIVTFLKDKSILH